MFFIGMAFGVAIGWAFPQPQWVKDTWAKIKAKI